MNQTQKNYAMRRLEDLAFRKKNEIEKKYTNPGDYLTTEKMYDLIKSGKAKLRPKKAVMGCEIKGYSYSHQSHRMEWTLRDIFKLERFETHPVRDTKKIEKAVTRLESEIQRLRDKIMLGDSQEALDLLEAFVKKEF